MIRKIQGNEYLKRYDNMTAQEREEYEGRVGQWLSDNSHMLAQKGEVFEARMQNVLQVSGTWNDQECQTFEEGARLLSALVPTADTWLPDMLYVKSAKRAIRQMVEVLWAVDEGNGTSRQNREEQGGGAGMQAGAAKETPIQPDVPFQGSAGHGDIAGGDKEGETQVKPDGDAPGTVAGTVVPTRPKHIDQYVHLLPKKTQEHAALVQGLFRELDDARQKMQLLMDDPKASASDREAWAKKATKCDNTLRKIFDELDAEWAKLVKSGRVVVDDLGNARVLPAADATGTIAEGDGENAAGVQGDESDGEASGTVAVELTSEQKARRRELRKWLVDTRRGNGNTREEYVRKWEANFREYLTLEGDGAYKDEKILDAAKHYGIELGARTAEHSKAGE